MTERDYQPWAEDEGDDLTEVVAALEPGTFFAERFRVDGRLGMGAMGKVVTAFDSVTNQRVALKVLHRERAAQREAVERFAREAEVLARLGHPGIVRVVASDRTRDGARWLAMELIEGDTLGQRIRKGPMSPAEAYPLISVLCDALDAAHREGIVHRDLKPDNIMLPKSGEPPCKILDFGLARINQLNAERLTRAGTILGTPRYMAPELIKTLRDTDHRADVFAVGVITFELLTGKSIYAADDVGQLFGAILEGRTRKLRELKPELPESLEAVLVRATALEPAARQQTAGAFAESYAQALGIPSMRSQLIGASELFEPTGAEAPDEQAGAPLVDPYAPSLSLRPPRLPSFEPPHAAVAPSRGPIVVVAPMHTVSDRPGPAPAPIKPPAGVMRRIGSVKPTAAGIPAAPATPYATPSTPYVAPPESQRPAAAVASSASATSTPSVRPVSYAQPGLEPSYGEGGRPFSDRPPPFAGADQRAVSVHAARPRSFTPPLGVTHTPPHAFPAPPVSKSVVPGRRRRRTAWLVLAFLLALALALGLGLAARWVVDRSGPAGVGAAQ